MLLCFKKVNVLNINASNYTFFSLFDNSPILHLKNLKIKKIFEIFHFDFFLDSFIKKNIIFIFSEIIYLRERRYLEDVQIQ